MDSMFELEDACLTIRLPKEVDHPVSDHIRKDTDKRMGNTYIRTMIFDFSETGFMDSSGIGLIMGRYKALGMRPGCVWAVHVNPHIDKLLRMSGLHRYVKIQKIREQEGVYDGEYQ